MGNRNLDKSGYLKIGFNDFIQVYYTNSLFDSFSYALAAYYKKLKEILITKVSFKS